MKLFSRDLKELDVSIIIVSYNTKQLTLQCIESILDLVKNVKYEVIVIDNGSTDSSITAIRNFQFPISNFQLKIIENKENLGFAKANNQGINVASGRYILLLNSDTVVKKEAIEKLIVIAEKKKYIGAVVPRLLNPDKSIQGSVFRFPTVFRAIKQYWLGSKGFLDKYYPRTKSPTEIESAVMAAFLITPQALKKAGFLNEKYFMYFEDLDYCRKISKSGLKIFYLPDSEIIHYHGASGEKLKKNEIQFMRLKKSSQIYHGLLKYSLITFIIWSGQKWQQYFKKEN